MRSGSVRCQARRAWPGRIYHLWPTVVALWGARRTGAILHHLSLKAHPVRISRKAFRGKISERVSPGRKRLIAAIAIFAGIDTAFSGEISPEKVLEQCGAVAEKDARIACYDRLNPPRAVAAAVASAPATASTPVPVTASAPARLQLDHGQIWTQTERRAGTIINAGESVTISRHTFGSYQLVASSGASVWVRRVQ